MPEIAFIGMGEAGSAFVSGWGPAVAGSVRAFDIKTDDPATADALWNRYRALGVTGCATLAEALEGAEIVFSTVTADQAVTAAGAAAAHLGPGCWYFDLNSCTPSSKRQNAERVEAAGGRYVDVAVMAPVHPARNKVACLTSGPHAADAAPVMSALPMVVRVVGAEVGRASSIKMIRSVLVKGLEALTSECVLAAVAAGVEDEVLPSLLDGHPNLDVARRAAYNFERMMVHGARRAAEMEEVAKTLADLGLPNRMSLATAAWERDIVRAHDGEVPPDSADFALFAELLLPGLRG